jgi:hypothetical protein
MLEPMKKRPIKIAFTGPVGNRERAIDALKKLGFVESTDSVPWREAFPDLTDDQLPGNSLKVTSQKVMVVLRKSLDTPNTSCYAHDV